MPYNSSAFEKQLAKFKEQQAGKEEKTEDAHVAKPRIEVGRGTVVPTLAEVSEQAPAKPAPAAVPEELVVAAAATAPKPFYKRGWFTFLLFSVVTSAAMPVVFKSQMDEMMGMANSVHSSSGVDIFAPDTYRKIFSGAALTANRQQAESEAQSQPIAENPIRKIVSKVKAEAAAKTEVVKSKIEASEAVPTSTQTPTDMHEIVNMATQKAQEVTAQGPEKSMQYIESEAKRLQEMAEQFDNTYGAKNQ